MLSLPLQPPLDDGSAWMGRNMRLRFDTEPADTSNPPQQTHRQRLLRDEEKRQLHARSALALVAADEAAIAQRKANVRTYGAYWLRPPGVAKTLQAMTEEEAERREQAELERQEQGLRDMQAQQQLEEAAAQAAAGAAAAAAGDAPEERDLDADIPEAPERDLDDDIPDADEEDTTDVTFNEESMMEGSSPGRSAQENDERYAALEEAELTGAAQDEEDLGLEHERNLDDSIPEAGSYQHTDTEVEDTDSDSDSELQNSFAAQSARRAAAAAATPASTTGPGVFDLRSAVGLQERMRRQLAAVDALPRSPGSLRLSSSLHESSLLDSSPMLPRANVGGRGGRAGPARRRGRPS